MTTPEPEGAKPPRAPRALTLAVWAVALAGVAWVFLRGGDFAGEGASASASSTLRLADFDACAEKTPAQMRKWLGPPTSIDSVRPGAGGGQASNWNWYRYVRDGAADEPTHRTITVVVESLPSGETRTVSCEVR